jgi:hypothetical protein
VAWWLVWEDCGESFHESKRARFNQSVKKDQLSIVRKNDGSRALALKFQDVFLLLLPFWGVMGHPPWHCDFPRNESPEIFKAFLPGHGCGLPWFPQIAQGKESEFQT